jgi:Skp family chaperone for outer membrane proteins
MMKKILLLVIGCCLLVASDLEARRWRRGGGYYRGGYGYGWVAPVVVGAGFVGTAAVVSANERANRAEAAAAQARADQAWSQRDAAEKISRMSNAKNKRIERKLQKLDAEEIKLETKIDKLEKASGTEANQKALDQVRARLREVKEKIEDLENQLG